MSMVMYGLFQSKLISETKAWELAADYCLKFESSDDVNDALDLDYQELQTICLKITEEAAAKLRDAFVRFRQRVRTTRTAPVANPYRFHFGVNTTKQGKLSKRGKQRQFLCDIVNPITPLEHTRA